MYYYYIRKEEEKRRRGKGLLHFGYIFIIKKKEIFLFLYSYSKTIIGKKNTKNNYKSVLRGGRLEK